QQNRLQSRPSRRNLTPNPDSSVPPQKQGHRIPPIEYSRCPSPPLAHHQSELRQHGLPPLAAWVSYILYSRRIPRKKVRGASRVPLLQSRHATEDLLADRICTVGGHMVVTARVASLRDRADCVYRVVDRLSQRLVLVKRRLAGRTSFPPAMHPQPLVGILPH